MRTAAMRRMASLVMAMVWAVARIAQPLQPACPHHAEAPSAAHAHHGAQLEASGDHSPSSPLDGPAHSTPTCECAAHCCAAAAVSMPQSAWSATILVSVATESSTFGAPTNPVVRLWSHWQPPSTAPPVSFTA